MHIKGRRAKPVYETQMISLADIAFLIIFFFLMTSSFMKDKAHIALPILPKSGNTDSVISVSLDGSKVLTLNGKVEPNKEALTTDLKGLLEGKKGDKLQVRFRAEKNLKYADYGPIYDAIGDAGGSIAIMHEVAK